MDQENLRALLVVADIGSIQAAAHKLGITRSSLRRRIDELEAEVGVPLLHRDTAGVRLTAAGAVVVEQGRLLLEKLRALLANARSAAGEAAGVIRVIEPAGMPLALRVELLLAVHGAAPKLKLAVRQVEDPLSHLHEPCELLLHEGPPPHKSTWFSRVIRRESLRVLAAPAYLRARGVPLRLADLASHDILGWRRPNQRADAWPVAAGGVVEVSPWLASPDFLLLQTIAVQGGGLLLAPHGSIVDPAAPEPLVRVLDDLVQDELVFRVSTPHLAHADARTRAIMEQIQRWLEMLPEQ